MDHNKKSGNDRIEVQHKAEVEEILDGNRPSLTPKLLGSSLDLNEVGIEEEEIPFDEITGRNKWKSRSDIQEEEPRKANRSEVGKVKNLLENLIYQKNEEQEYKRKEREEKYRKKGERRKKATGI